MANHKSAEKMIRKITKRTAVNKNRRSLVKTAVKKAEVALGIRVGSTAPALAPTEAKPVLVAAERQLMRAAQKGAINKKAASRKVSRLNKKLKTLAS
ncbi:MAG: 30S ribosomal protein S20 [Alphaproteobacteria bacterium]|nr:MAG: 30S ribosomal protein S20 [Alphaproteobacteria bacterium]